MRAHQSGPQRPRAHAGARRTPPAWLIAADCTNNFIANTAFELGSFDTATCISVLEHIPADTEAVRKMWELLKPGGTLVLTVPVMAQACEQYIDYDEYSSAARHPRLRLLAAFLRCTTARGARVQRYRHAGHHGGLWRKRGGSSPAGDAERKRRGHGYPFWREPYMMATEYRFFDTLEALPGDGVIGMTFVKR